MTSKDKPPTKIKENATAKMAIMNSFTTLVDNLCGRNPFESFDTAQISQDDTFFRNLRWYLISNNRQLISEMYVEHGVIQTLVDQPVDDAFRTGFEIKTSELDKDDIEKLQIYLERNEVIKNIIQALKWARLYGGGGILLITDDNPMTPFNPDKVNEKTKIRFRGVDMWELFSVEQPTQGEMNLSEIERTQHFFNYYGKQVHPSRVYRITGKEPPSFVRPRLRGWGMSELEKVVRSLNQYLKNQDVVFELLDEAKVDVYGIEGFNDAMLNKDGTEAVANQIQLSNVIKNYVHAIVMDKNDTYEQKQLSFAGLSEILTQIRQGLAADLKMPMTKLFGISAAGFNSGEDDIENYNSMIESEIRSKIKFVVLDIIELCCRNIFGFAPKDLMIKFNPLRELSAKEEEEVKTAKFNRVIATANAGLMTTEEFKICVNKDNLLPVEIDETIDALPQIEGEPDIAPEKL